MPAPRNWSRLSAGSRRRWIAALGGKGSPVRRAKRAAQAYEAGAHLRPEQRGHESSAVRQARSISGFVGPGARFVDFRAPNRGDLRRLARYDALVGQLSRGQITNAEFRRKVSSWRPIAGQGLTSDPDAVLARLDELRAQDQETFHYYSGRAA